MNKAENPVTAVDIRIYFHLKRETKICNMLRMDNHVWSGQLGDINITEMIIDLVPDAELFKSPPYQAVHKTREFKQSETDKKLKSGVIE